MINNAFVILKYSTDLSGSSSFDIHNEIFLDEGKANKICNELNNIFHL